MRLAISLEVKPTSTPDEAVRAIDMAITRHARIKGMATLSPWPPVEHRGIIAGAHGVAIGTFRLLDDETKPEAIAAVAMERMLKGRAGDVPQDMLEMMQRIAADAVREDRRNVVKIAPDDDF